MKASILSFLFLLLFLFSGCKSADDSYPPYSYHYYLAFVDESGHDLLAGVETSLGADGGLVLQEKTYSYEFVKPNSKDHFLDLSLIRLVNMNGYNALGISLSMSDWYAHKKPEVLTHKLSCSFIFGDQERHELISYWNFDSDYTEAELIRLTVDGKEGRISEGLGKFFPLVTVTLDK